MINYYSTIDEVVLTFSNIKRNEQGFETIIARFERANNNGFDYAEWKLPCISNIKGFGFSEDEILEQERYLRNNSILIWEIAREKELSSIA
ncbi:hypothetical protein NE619_01750 [Anaerovorax odorimutans]|uniref:Uncharacterized protein n=1 Tax=Anaerovorax odorimutans TaxID=109327 RepID=A0ABT1RKF1_9FIRM|nr:hypothetical protein [Anaerovorax odorimutans]MCQ4635441.1 hypothetical protein [Anaerovorax odorimutans]